ncbi:Ger(x)C family spore germination protein [Paenibacillus polymyxa]|uniref:Ger(x)C family spore germination protein n=1 Tax=Paenibacillus polymyxa TaxID=1406 RepID=UPI0025B6E7CC|nr:Ger(x)C family spore germination protein [Paenibacillus polymyxa]MDN4080651.1 Ger(x)C family spore germination protein [Paenibacillus polymyxa]MDN4084712.1 Ger(x)C family spore germination protein [Paenibacillus polymyxa]MDN4090208.1 Ger(x)C family spore germination protein [Paenibacillus polymyxa]MDN4105928.1 Ger(x)C family spore germination protein [Paenibacillus polymyxa]MDN4110982.1 Ger(x)C family spore germination protein [Paenibacillus polymyxa]
MKQTIHLLFIWGLIALLLGGCWDRKELNELGIAIGIGIDMEGDQYQVTAQVVIPSAVASKSSPSSGSPVVTYQATAPTIQEAIQKMTDTSPRSIYLSHIRMLILGEEYARKGISDAIEALMREPFTRSDFYIAIAKNNKASTVLNIPTSLEKLPANKMFASLDTLTKTWAPATKVTMDQMLSDLANPDIQSTLPALEAVGNVESSVDKGEDDTKSISPETILRFSGIGVLKKDRLLGWISERDSKGFNYIRNTVESTTGHADCQGGGNIALLTLSSNTQKKVIIRDGEPVISISVTNDSTVREVNCKHMKLSSMADIKEIEAASNEKIVEIMRHSVETVRHEFKSDIFGFGQLIHQSKPELWKRLKEEKENPFMDLQIEYKAKTKIKKIGSLFESFQKQMKE